jgi:hypothetical protein
MAYSAIPREVREFVFSHIDAVEHLEVLLFLRNCRGAGRNADQIGAELRTNPQSVARRLIALETSQLLVKDNAQQPWVYRYEPATPQLARTIDLLAEAYRVRRHTVFELIFSPMKAARHLAEAIRFKKSGIDDV